MKTNWSRIWGTSGIGNEEKRIRSCKAGLWKQFCNAVVKTNKQNISSVLTTARHIIIKVTIKQTIDFTHYFVHFTYQSFRVANKSKIK